MDIIDDVSYRWDIESTPEKTRQAYCNLFDVTSEDARLVARHLVLSCKWLDQTEYNDPVIESKLNSLRGIIREIKKQLNQEVLKLGEIDE